MLIWILQWPIHSLGPFDSYKHQWTASPVTSASSMVSQYLSQCWLIIPPASTKLKGGYTGITLSVCPSVRLSVCGQNRVRSVSSTILIGSISYLHILSSNFRRCVACNARFKIKKFVTLTLSSFDLLFLVSFLRCHCRLQFRMDSFHIWYKWSIAWEGVSHVMTFDLDLYLQGHSALT